MSKAIIKTDWTSVSVVATEEMVQQLNWVRNDTRRLMTDVYNLRQDYNKITTSCQGSPLRTLEDRIDALEIIVRRLEDYIENGVDTK